MIAFVPLPDVLTARVIQSPYVSFVQARVSMTLSCGKGGERDAAWPLLGFSDSHERVGTRQGLWIPAAARMTGEGTGEYRATNVFR